MDLDLSLVTDGLAAEREQGITIDVAYRYFDTEKRKFIIADTPGHVQYTRNMVTGASTANVAVILIDARLGVLQQSRRHAYIASLLRIPHLAVCVNKMDLVAYSREVFDRIRTEFSAFVSSAGIPDVCFFPVSALLGDNCVKKSALTPWYDGPTVLDYLESVPVQDDRDLERLRLPVQYVLRPTSLYRGFAGRLASGVVRKGDPVLVLPSGKTSQVQGIDTFEGELQEAFAPQSVTVRLQDEIDISRGDMLVHPTDVPRVARSFDAHLVWMHESALDAGKTYLLKHTTQIVRADIDRVHWRKDMDTLEEVSCPTLNLNEIGKVTITAHRPLFVDPYALNRETGSFILIDVISNNTVAAGMVVGEARRERATTLRSADLGQPRSQVTPKERRGRYGVSEGVVLLSGGLDPRVEALAYAIERRLFDCDASGVVLGAAEGDRVLLTARAIADAGLLAIAVAESEAIAAGAASVLEGRRVLAVHVTCAEPTLESARPEESVRPAESAAGAGLALDLGASTVEQAADSVLSALRDRGWLGR
jgi:sulfate adenylyltransferase large subunit